MPPELPINTVIEGHTPKVLSTLPAESIDELITSPPYYGLRSYGTEPQIWKGEKELCENGDHEWIVENKKINLQAGNEEFKRPWREKATDKEIKSAFCSKCGAWKGELGQEPTPKLYIEHLLQIFDEAKRVLKKTGTCWVNISDSYSSSGDSSRNYLGIELNKNYFQIQEKRIGNQIYLF